MSSGPSIFEVFAQALDERRIRVAGGSMDALAVGGRLQALRSHPIESRESVGMVFENGPACLENYLAFAFADVVAVPLPPTLPDAERQRLWLSAGCRYYVDLEGVHPIPDALDGVTRWPAGIHWVMHSSGSTGVPKAIPLTFEAVRRNAGDVMDLLGYGTDLVHLGSMSQCYTNGLFNSFLLPLLTGGKCVVGPVASALKVRQYLQLVRSERPEILWVNPAVVSMLMRQGIPEDFTSVKALISCTAPLDADLCRAAAAAFGRPVLQSFGTTETLIVSVETPGRDARTHFSSGKIVGGRDAVVVGDDSVLRIQNGAVTPGYATCSAGEVTMTLPDGGVPTQRFVSGDLAMLSATGELHIIGRTTNVINVGGVKISAEQLEEVLRADPAVVEAAVTSLKLPDGGERPVAFVQARAPIDKDRLIETCVSRLGSKSRLADIHVVSALPRTGNGKVDRGALMLKLGS